MQTNDFSAMKTYSTRCWCILEAATTTNKPITCSRTCVVETLLGGQFIQFHICIILFIFRLFLFLRYFATEIHLGGLVVAKALVFSSEKVLVKHQEVSILANRNRTLGGLDAQLFGAVDGIA